MQVKWVFTIVAMAGGLALAPVIAAPASGVVQNPSASSASATLAQVQRHLRDVGTMTASFAQTDRRGKVVTGMLTLKRPGRVRFEYAKPVPLLIVGDGRALTMIDYSVKQVSTWPIGNSPLSVLLNPDKDMSRFAKVVPSNDPAIVLIAAKDPKHPEFGVISIAFTRQASAPAGLMMQGWSVVDAQNNHSTVRLSNQRFNVAVSDKAFLWSDPRPRQRM
jgi:outer membrane lipoprotein-sorting protein